jgi:hypothetical protein
MNQASTNSMSRAEAARANGATSNGPKTIEGKARSSQNALKHGLSAAKWLTLPGDEAGAYEEFYEAINEDLAPVGALEQAMVDKMVQSLWRQRRVMVMEANLIDRKESKKAPSGVKFYAWDSTKLHLNISRYEANLDRSFERSRKALKELQSARNEKSPNEPKTNEPLSTPVERGRGEARQPDNHHEADNQTTNLEFVNGQSSVLYEPQAHSARDTERPLAAAVPDGRHSTDHNEDSKNGHASIADRISTKRTQGSQQWQGCRALQTVLRSFPPVTRLLLCLQVHSPNVTKGPNGDCIGESWRTISYGELWATVSFGRRPRVATVDEEAIFRAKIPDSE